MDERTSFNLNQIQFFCKDLFDAFVTNGFEVLEEPYFDCNLYGYRATYVRRYESYKPMPQYQRLLTTIIQVVGLPFGRQNRKMVILSTPKSLKNEPICEAVKLRVNFDEFGQASIQFGDHKSNISTSNSMPYKDFQDQQSQQTKTTSEINKLSGKSLNENSKCEPRNNININDTYNNNHNDIQSNLKEYVKLIIEAISPGLIQLPIEMKLEILKKLSVESIIRMSQVNNEFKWIIFNRGEILWQHLCMRDFNATKINRRVHKSWKELYKDLYVLHQVEMCRKSRALTAAPELLALPPLPGRLPIEWPFHYPLAMPLYPFPDPHIAIALDFAPRRRLDSVGSLS